MIESKPEQGELDEKDDSGKNQDDKRDENSPGNTLIEKILKERFGAPDFGSIMDSIVNEMLKSVDQDKNGKQP